MLESLRGSEGPEETWNENVNFPMEQEGKGWLFFLKHSLEATPYFTSTAMVLMTPLFFLVMKLCGKRNNGHPRPAVPTRSK